MIGYSGDIAERARELALTRMTEKVEVGEFEDGTDPVTLDATRVLTVERYKGVGQVILPSLATSDREGPAQPLTEQSPVLRVPTGTPLLHRGDQVRVTASTADRILVDRWFEIDGMPQGGQTSSHRYPLSEL